jgi:hypothetical protein
MMTGSFGRRDFIRDWTRCCEYRRAVGIWTGTARKDPEGKIPTDLSRFEARKWIEDHGPWAQPYRRGRRLDGWERFLNMVTDEEDSLIDEKDFS